MELVDTHAHLTDPAFGDSIPAVLLRAGAAGVTRVVCVGTTAHSSREAVALAQRFPAIWASTGIHPNYSHQATEDDWDAIRELCRKDRVVALGETGLDRYWKDADWETQCDSFRKHWALSRETGLPVIIHSRDCDREMVEFLRETAGGGKLHGVMHAFSGTLEMAEACLELGLYLSFAGMVTYKKSTALREVAMRVPDDRLLVETDSPYLSPEPKRGQRPNEPAMVCHTAECLAASRGMKLEELAVMTTANAKRLFQLTAASTLG